MFIEDIALRNHEIKYLPKHVFTKVSNFIVALL